MSHHYVRHLILTVILHVVWSNGMSCLVRVLRILIRITYKGVTCTPYCVQPLYRSPPLSRCLDTIANINGVLVRAYTHPLSFQTSTVPEHGGLIGQVLAPPSQRRKVSIPPRAVRLQVRVCVHIGGRWLVAHQEPSPPSPQPPRGLKCRCVRHVSPPHTVAGQDSTVTRLNVVSGSAFITHDIGKGSANIDSHMTRASPSRAISHRCPGSCPRPPPTRLHVASQQRGLQPFVIYMK